jgi:hypothetical protein
MFTPILNVAIMRLRDIKDSGMPRLARAADRHNRIENSDRYRKLIELRHSAPDEQVVQHLNLFCNRMIAAENCCPEARSIIRRTYGQASGLIETHRRVEHSIKMI